MTSNLIARIVTTAAAAGIIALGAGAAYASTTAADHVDLAAGPGVSDPWDSSPASDPWDVPPAGAQGSDPWDSAPVNAPMSDPWD